MSNTKKYWKGLDQLNGSPEYLKSLENEFPVAPSLSEVIGSKSEDASSTGRRDFLKFLGFSVGAATLAACETPINKAVPYLNKPEEITPGIANYYASSYFDGYDYASIMVKTREGRPIKIEGNKLSSVNGNGVNARVNSSVLSLYDIERLKNPLAGGKDASWDKVDGEIKEKLAEISGKGGNITLLTGTIISPATKQAISEFSSVYKTVKHVTYDAVSSTGILKANEASFGKAVLPDYKFDKADVIVSFGADFLVNWLSSLEYAKGYAVNRNPKKKSMSRHFQFETNLSLSGSNADVRVPVKPSESAKAVINLYNLIAAKSGASSLASEALEFDKDIAKAAKELWDKRGKSLVVSGSNDVNVQVIVNAINYLLGNYGSTIDLDNPSYIRQGIDADMIQLVDDMNAGKVGALLVYNCNPAYTYPDGTKFTAGLKKVGLTVSFSGTADETASDVNYVCPDNHYLESWGDLNPKKGIYSVVQPTISPLFKTRQFQESLLKWAGNSTNFYNYTKATWEKNVFPMQKDELFFESFWNKSLFNGGYEQVGSSAGSVSAPVADLSAAASRIKEKYKTNGEFEIEVYVKAGLGDGKQANNPWLQELPDPISKITWDNYITMSPRQMEEGIWGLSRLERGDFMADVLELTVNGKSMKVPVVPQPGQKYGTIGLALGYGRTKAGKVANNVGQNAFQLISNVNGSMSLSSFGAKLTKTSEKYEIAATQTHHTMMGRNIVKETILEKYINNPADANEKVLLSTTNHGKQSPDKVNLWQDHKIAAGHRWVMNIDLNTCIGCSACVTSCHSENNVPVVGKEEIRRSRDMHWLRIDRYYTSEMTEDKAKEHKKGAIDMYTDMETASPDNPSVVFQPIMCQHCNHAPCETVCPVAATTHSNEGFNQMTYNRCIGTRYCANNCPYKVRRFNWFKYSDNSEFDFNMNDDLGKMVLNPDVVVRSRGVMEKCSFCVQKVQDVKLTAKREKRKIKDGEVQTACSSVCPTNAINFGDFNDEGTVVNELAKDERAYFLLEELNVQPNVYYMTKVRNRTTEEA